MKSETGSLSPGFLDCWAVVGGGVKEIENRSTSRKNLICKYEWAKYYPCTLVATCTLSWHIRNQDR
jgi:hypothetical protein